MTIMLYPWLWWWWTQSPHSCWYNIFVSFDMLLCLLSNDYTRIIHFLSFFNNGSFLYFTKKGCKMSSSAGVGYLVGCLMGCTVPLSFSSSVRKQWSIRHSTMMGKLLEGIFLVLQCIHALSGLWTCSWHSQLTTSLLYNTFSSGVQLLCGIFLCWHMGPLLPPFLPTLTKSSLKPLHLLLCSGWSRSSWWSLP